VIVAPKGPEQRNKFACPQSGGTWHLESFTFALLLQLPVALQGGLKYYPMVLKNTTTYKGG